MSTDPRHALGKWGEEAALRHLESLGYEILARNFRTRSGELDLVARDRDEIVFVEVRTKRRGEHGHPFDTIGYRKQQQLLRMAAQFLARGPLPPELTARRQDAFCRFDVIGITIDPDGRSEIEHLRNAFTA